MSNGQVRGDTYGEGCLGRTGECPPYLSVATRGHMVPDRFCSHQMPCWSRFLLQTELFRCVCVCVFLQELVSGCSLAS